MVNLKIKIITKGGNENVIYMLSEMFNLPESKEVAG